LTSPNLIWPGLPLVLPPDPGENNQGTSDEASSPAEQAPEPAPAAVPEPATAVPSPTATVPPTATAEPLPPTASPASMEPTVQPPDEATPAPAEPAVQLEPVAPTEAPSESPVPPVLPLAVGLSALAVGGGLVGVGLARRRRRLEPLSDVPESDVKVEEGFAQADPSRDLAERLPGHHAEPDPVTLLVAQFGRFLQERGGDELAAQTRVLLARHGRSSTTLELVAPLAQQSRLLELAPGLTNTLGPGVGAEAEVTPDGDVALRVRGLRRANLQLRRAMLAPETIPGAVPTLVPVGVLADRQECLVNWGALGHVLVASPSGTGAIAVLTSLLAHVAARRTPAELQVRTIASPRALPAAMFGLPHQVGPAVDPQDQEAMAEALSAVRAELDRRLLAGSSSGEPEVVVIVSELLDLQPYLGLIGQLGERGAACGIRLVAASTRPGGALAAHPLLPDFSTRLVQRTADEDESVALLGTADAAYLGGGGRLLLRSEQRTPVELYAYRVAPADLDRLVGVMTAAHGAGTNGRRPAAPSPEADDDPGEGLGTVAAEADAAELVEDEPAVKMSPPEEPLRNGTSTSAEPVARPAAPTGSECPLSAEQEALLEVRCFAGPRVLRDGEELWPAAAPNREQKALQLLLFLAAHSADGVDRDKAAEALLGEEESADPTGTLRQWRRRVRIALNRLVPDLPEEDVFEDSGRNWRLNRRLVRSDVQRFLELDEWAKSKGRLDPEPAYEAMRALYVGDLFDRAAAQPYAWAVTPGPSGPSLVQEYRQMYQEATRLLAERYAATPDNPHRTEQALELYDELVRLDPTNERLWVALFRLHAHLSDRVALEREWRRLCQVLQEEEPGAEPRRTTAELYKQLLRELEREASLH
jgi:DNA-binding SARP family transcriptional activator